MADIRLPQFGDNYDGYKLRTLVDVLENTLTNISKVFAFLKKGSYQLYSSVTPVGNVGTGEDDLISYTLQANSLKKPGYNIKIQAWGTFASNADNKTLKMYFGTDVIYDSTALSLNGGSWCINATVARDTNTTQQAIVCINSSNTTLGSSATYTDTNQTLSDNVVIKFTGEATTDNDIIQKGLTISYYPQEA